MTIEGYALGDASKPGDFDTEQTREVAGTAACSLQVNDAAFIKRSDLKWTYAILTERTEEPVILRFDVDTDKNTKSFPQHQWGKYIRVIKSEKVPQNAVTAAPAEPVAPAPTKEETKSVAVAPVPISKTGSAETVTKEKPTPAAPASETITETKDEIPEMAPSMSMDSKSSKKKASKAAKSKKQEVSSSVGFFSKFFGSPSAKTDPEPAAVDTAKPSVTAEAAKPESTTTDEKSAPPVEQEVASEEKKDEPIATESEVKAAPSPEQKVKPLAIDSDASVVSTRSMKGKLKSFKGLVSPKASKETKPETEERDAAPISSPPVVVKEDKKPAPTPAPVDVSDDMSIASKSSTKSKLKAFKNALVSQKGAKKALETPVETNPAEERQDSSSSPATTGDKTDIKKKATIEWDNLKALECDYDENPSCIFQALEAREFKYAYDMFKDETATAEEECRTWIVARDLKSDEVKFRALPLHAAMVFGAPDKLVECIFDANPNAVRGRDLKGCLPVHYAFKNNASDLIVNKLITAFPKGYFVKDKSGKSCADHVDPKSTSADRLNIIGCIVAFGVEDEKGRWLEKSEADWVVQEAEIRDELMQVNQKTKEACEAAVAKAEEEHKRRLQIFEEQHRKELLKMKVKHADETQALLDGFKVKMDFEKKLRTLKHDAKK